MKKKLVITAIAGLLVLALAVPALAFASDGALSFEKMLPFMQKMHPDWSIGELKEMFNACHGAQNI